MIIILSLAGIVVLAMIPKLGCVRSCIETYFYVMFVYMLPFTLSAGLPGCLGSHLCLIFIRYFTFTVVNEDTASDL